MVSTAGWVTSLQGLASLGAGAINAAAVGIHAEHVTLSRLFVAVAAAQILVGLVTLVRGGRAVAVATAVVNGGAVVAWTVTRVWGISWMEGLDSPRRRGSPTPCAPPWRVGVRRRSRDIARLGASRDVAPARIGLG